MKKIKNLGGYISVDRKTLEEIDYVDKLNESEKLWLNTFCDNEYNARYFKNGTDVIKDREQQKRCNRDKQKRLVDFSNKLWPVQSDIDGFQILIPLNKTKKKKSLK